MKIRNDYVSNSSSSSFIIANCEFLDFFKVTKQDILDALIDSYGKKNYEERIASMKKYSEENPEYYKKNKKYNSFGPFYVYDLSIPSDRKEAIDMWGTLLKGWEASNCYIGENKQLYVGSDGTRAFNKALESIHAIYNVYDSDVKWWLSGEGDVPKVFIRENEKDPKTGMYGHYEDMPKYVLNFLKHLKKDCGFMDNLDVMKHSVSRFFVHADDNEIWTSDTDKKKGKKWESDYYTYDRVCEIVFKYLVKIGRIVPNDSEFLKKVEIDPGMLTKEEKENGEIYDVGNGKYLTWKDLKYATLTQCMHEG